jgi:hypothetical protein
MSFLALNQKIAKPMLPLIEWLSEKQRNGRKKRLNLNCF